MVTSVVLFPPPFYFVFYISNLLSYIQNNFSYELARLIMGTIFLVIIYNNIYIRDSRLNRPESVSLASLTRQLHHTTTKNVFLSAQIGERASVVLICIITSCYNEVK